MRELPARVQWSGFTGSGVGSTVRQAGGGDGDGGSGMAWSLPRHRRTLRIAHRLSWHYY